MIRMRVAQTTETIGVCLAYCELHIAVAGSKRLRGERSSVTPAIGGSLSQVITRCRHAHRTGPSDILGRATTRTSEVTGEHHIGQRAAVFIECRVNQEGIARRNRARIEQGSVLSRVNQSG